MREPGRPDGAEGLAADAVVGEPAQLGHRHLDPRDRAVVAHAAVGEAEGAQGALGGLDLGQLAGRDLLAVRDARREAGRRRLVGHAQAQGACQGAHARLGHARLGQRAQHRVLGRRPRARPVHGHGVVRVLAVGHRVQSVGRDLLGADAFEQLGLAVVAAVGPVGPVRGALPLVRGELDEGRPQLAGHLTGHVQFVARQRRRHGEERHDGVRPEGAERDGEQHGRVDAARIGHAEACPGRERARDGQGVGTLRLGQVVKGRHEA